MIREGNFQIIQYRKFFKYKNKSIKVSKAVYKKKQNKSYNAKKLKNKKIYILGSVRLDLISDTLTIRTKLITIES